MRPIIPVVMLMVLLGVGIATPADPKAKDVKDKDAKAKDEPKGTILIDQPQDAVIQRKNGTRGRVKITLLTTEELRFIPAGGKTVLTYAAVSEVVRLIYTEDGTYYALNPASAKFDRYDPTTGTFAGAVPKDDPVKGKTDSTDKSKMDPAAKAKLDAERAKMDAERAKLETDKAKVDAERLKVDAEKAKFEAEKAKEKTEPPTPETKVAANPKPKDVETIDNSPVRPSPAFPAPPTSTDEASASPSIRKPASPGADRSPLNHDGPVVPRLAGRRDVRFIGWALGVSTCGLLAPLLALVGWRARCRFCRRWWARKTHVLNLGEPTGNQAAATAGAAGFYCKHCQHEW